MTVPDRLSANLAWLFTELPWLDRFAAARRAGFATVEFPWPDDPAATAEAVRAAELRVGLLNMAAGDLAAGERGWPNDPDRVEEWRAAVTDAVALARLVGCRSVNVLAGNAVPAVAMVEQQATLIENLAWAVAYAERHDVVVVTELLNRRENPTYLLPTLSDVEPLVARLAPLGWRVQMDTHHLAMSGADVPAALREARGLIGHVQVADAPGRHEPGSGTLDWTAIGAVLAEVRYRGPIGLEYEPAAGTVDGLPHAVAVLTGAIGLSDR